MSATINLREVHTRVACIQAECALWQIRRQWERLLATTTDETRRVQIAELLREGRCPPDRVIRGYHGRFVGCADGGGGSGHMPEGGIHTRGGIKSESDLRDLMSDEGRKSFFAKRANATEMDYEAEVGRLSSKAHAGAKAMTEDDLTPLRTHAANLEKLLDPSEAHSLIGRLLTMQRQITDSGRNEEGYAYMHASKEYQSLRQEAARRQEELDIIRNQLARNTGKYQMKDLESRGTRALGMKQADARTAKSAKTASAKAAKVADDTTKTSGSRTSGVKTERESLDDLHARARELRAKEGLPDEVKPESLPKNNHGVPIIQPKSDADFATPQDLFGKVTARDYAKLYGEEKLGVALSQLTHETLRGVAKDEGIDPKNMSKTELVSRITAKATNGRYSADFGTKKSSASTKSTGTSRPKSGASKSAHAKFMPIGEASKAQSNDLFAKVDVSEYHRLYGTLQLPGVLGELTPATLRSVAREWAQAHPEDGQPRLSSKKDIIDYLVKNVVREQGHIGPKTQDELNQVLADRKAGK